MAKKALINVYTCAICELEMVTRDSVEGTTPFIVRCKSTPGCKGEARSAFYRVSQRRKPKYEWYKPTELELTVEITKGKERHKPEEFEWFESAVREHVAQGGLLLRRLT